MEPNKKEIAQHIIDNAHLMSLATVDDGGPWVSDVVFVADDKFNFYWQSHPEVRHSKAIHNNQKVAAAITITHKSGEPNQGLQIEGVAHQVEGDLPDMAAKHSQKRNQPVQSAEGNPVNTDHSWYCLEPTKIEIIHEPSWGFRKEQLDI